MSDATIAVDQLRLLIERIERLEEEKKGINDDIKDVYLELKATGYDVKTTRAIIRLRKLEKHVRQEAEALLETYMAALGMDSAQERTPDMFQGHDGRPEPSRPAPPPNTDEGGLIQEACALVVTHQNAATSWLQRQMRLGYNQAARIMDRLEAANIVSQPNHLGRRDVLVDDIVSAAACLVSADLANRGITMTVLPQVTRS